VTPPDDLEDEIQQLKPELMSALAQSSDFKASVYALLEVAADICVDQPLTGQHAKKWHHMSFLDEAFREVLDMAWAKINTNKIINKLKTDHD
jgi:uncharacterized protein (DUF2236 family)